ncbi:MAG: hypothetical protein RBR53_06845 [Desulforegulaceae bacterium]|nr:hypothetical protein [Desulforegulaceae bacterium]
MQTDVDENYIDFFRKHERIGRPAGNDIFIENLEKKLNRKLEPKKSGPKNKFDN